MRTQKWIGVVLMALLAVGLVGCGTPFLMQTACARCGQMASYG